MRRFLVLALSTLLLVATASCAASFRKPRASAGERARIETGTLGPIEDGRLELVRAEGTADEPSLSVELAKDAEVLRDGVEVGPGALVEGEPVRVFFETSKDAPATAVRVELLTGDEGARILDQVRTPFERTDGAREHRHESP